MNRFQNAGTLHIVTLLRIGSTNILQNVTLLRIFLVLVLFLCSCGPVAFAQRGADVPQPPSLPSPVVSPYGNRGTQVPGTFADALRLRTEGRLSEAADIVVALLKESPRQQRYLETGLEILLQDKQLQRGLDLARTSPLRDNPKITLLEGDLLYQSGNREQAFTLWKSLGEREGTNNRWQFSETVGQRLHSYGEYQEEVSHYAGVRTLRKDSTLFIREMALAQLQLGEVELAMEEYLRGLSRDPSLLSTIHSQLSQIMDERWLERAISRLENELERPDQIQGQELLIVQLLGWIHLRNGSYQRGYEVSRSFERSRNYSTYSLYSYGQQLLTYKQHALGIAAFTDYADSASGINDLSIRRDAMFRIADAYLSWSTSIRSDPKKLPLSAMALNDSAETWLAGILPLEPSPKEVAKALGTKARLRLEHSGRLDVELNQQVQTYLSHIQSGPFQLLPRDSGISEDPDSRYLEGLLALYEERYVDARIAFTDVIRGLSPSGTSLSPSTSSRQQRPFEPGYTLSLTTSELLERARYHLGLAEVFSGEAAFATIQFSTMQKEISSYLANDALRMTSILQQVPTGVDADSVLAPFFSSLRKLFLDKDDFLNDADSLANQPRSAWVEEILLFWSSRVSPKDLSDFQALLETQTHIGKTVTDINSKHGETLLWLHILAVEASEAAKGSEALQANEGSETTKPHIETLLTTYLQRYPRGYYRFEVAERLRNLRENAL